MVAIQSLHAKLRTIEQKSGLLLVLKQLSTAEVEYGHFLEARGLLFRPLLSLLDLDDSLMKTKTLITLMSLFATHPVWRAWCAEKTDIITKLLDICASSFYLSLTIPALQAICLEPENLDRLSRAIVAFSADLSTNGRKLALFAVLNDVFRIQKTGLPSMLVNSSFAKRILPLLSSNMVSIHQDATTVLVMLVKQALPIRQVVAEGLVSYWPRFASAEQQYNFLNTLQQLTQQVQEMSELLLECGGTQILVPLAIQQSDDKSVKPQSAAFQLLLEWSSNQQCSVTIAAAIMQSVKAPASSEDYHFITKFLVPTAGHLPNALKKHGLIERLLLPHVTNQLITVKEKADALFLLKAFISVGAYDATLLQQGCFHALIQLTGHIDPTISQLAQSCLESLVTCPGNHNALLISALMQEWRTTTPSKQKEKISAWIKRVTDQSSKNKTIFAKELLAGLINEQGTIDMASNQLLKMLNQGGQLDRTIVSFLVPAVFQEPSASRASIVQYLHELNKPALLSGSGTLEQWIDVFLTDHDDRVLSLSQKRLSLVVSQKNTAEQNAIVSILLVETRLKRLIALTVYANADVAQLAHNCMELLTTRVENKADLLINVLMQEWRTTTESKQKEKISAWIKRVADQSPDKRGALVHELLAGLINEQGTIDMASNQLLKMLNQGGQLDRTIVSFLVPAVFQEPSASRVSIVQYLNQLNKPLLLAEAASLERWIDLFLTINDDGVVFLAQSRLSLVVSQKNTAEQNAMVSILLVETRLRRLMALTAHGHADVAQLAHNCMELLITSAGNNTDLLINVLMQEWRTTTPSKQKEKISAWIKRVTDQSPDKGGALVHELLAGLMNEQGAIDMASNQLLKMLNQGGRFDDTIASFFVPFVFQQPSPYRASAVQWLIAMDKPALLLKSGSLAKSGDLSEWIDLFLMGDDDGVVSLAQKKLLWVVNQKNTEEQNTMVSILLVETRLRKLIAL